jgi:PAS domain S-box-containing protein
MVLVVDDSPDILALVHSLLSGNFQVKSANNGKRGLQIAQGEHLPDLILLDIMMPDMNGYQVCKQLKRNPRTCDVPIIFLTSKSDTENEEEAFAQGAVDYVTKPIGPSVLLARVKAHLAAHAHRRSLEVMFRDVIEYAPVMFLIADQHLNIVQTNAQAEQHFEYKREELIGRNLMTLLPQCPMSLHLPTNQLNTQMGEARVDANPELTCVRRDGSSFPGSATFSRLETPQGLLHTVVLVNATDKKDTLRKLSESQESLRELAAINETARENERKHIAREVHDELGQVMTALRMSQCPDFGKARSLKPFDFQFPGCLFPGQYFFAQQMSRLWEGLCPLAATGQTYRGSARVARSEYQAVQVWVSARVAQDHGKAQRQQLQYQVLIVERSVEFAQLAAVAKHQQAQPVHF